MGQGGFCKMFISLSPQWPGHGASAAMPPWPCCRRAAGPPLSPASTRRPPTRSCLSLTPPTLFSPHGNPNPNPRSRTGRRGAVAVRRASPPLEATRSKPTPPGAPSRLHPLPRAGTHRGTPGAVAFVPAPSIRPPHHAGDSGRPGAS